MALLGRRRRKLMTKTDALLLMLEHSKCFSANWVLSPEGREYKARFDAAIVALSDGVKVGDGGTAPKRLRDMTKADFAGVYG